MRSRVQAQKDGAAACERALDPTSARTTLQAKAGATPPSRLTQTERSRAIRGAIASGDDVVVSTLLDGPAMLSGMSPAKQDLHREQWRRKRYAAEVNRVGRLKDAPLPIWIEPVSR